jgi:hypothetical protein
VGEVVVSEMCIDIVFYNLLNFEYLQNTCYFLVYCNTFLDKNNTLLIFFGNYLGYFIKLCFTFFIYQYMLLDLLWSFKFFPYFVLSGFVLLPNTIFIIVLH